MDVKTWLRDNRYAVGAVGVGAAAGAYVWWRRTHSGTTGAGAGGSTDGSAGGYIANPAAANTTGTDTANWVGQTLGNYSDALANYQQTLTSEIDQLKQIVGQQQGTTGPSPAPTPVTVPPRRTPPARIPPSSGTTVGQMLALNPYFLTHPR